MQKRIYAWVTTCFFVLAVLLRVALCWSNPPENAFDDHFEPIVLILKSGAIPAKDACWQCYHPPVFYVLSAAAAKAALATGLRAESLPKFLQWICCFYGIATVGIVYLILRKLRLSDFSRLIAFGTVCFLPRHIYMSAMHSNDALSYLLVAASIYLLLLAIEKRLSLPAMLLSGIAITLAVFTKYTAFALLPAAAVPMLFFFKQKAVPRKRAVLAVSLILCIPLVLLGWYAYTNQQAYGAPLPWNVSQLDPSVTQPRDPGGISFTDFNFRQSLQSPLLAPGRMNSVWTSLYNSMWFDSEPKFLYFLDGNSNWWYRYYGWLRGEGEHPGTNAQTTALTRTTASGLVLFGFFPLVFTITGFLLLLIRLATGRELPDAVERIKLSMFPVLLLANFGGVLALIVRLPVYCSMKASYLLNSLPAFAVCLSFGLMQFEHKKAFRQIALAVFGVLFALSTIHILHIVYSVYRFPGNPVLLRLP